MLTAFSIVLVISIQVTQQVDVAKDWVRSSTNSLNAEIQNRHDVEKHSARQTTKKHNWPRSSRLQRMGEKVWRLGWRVLRLKLRTSAKSFTLLNLTSPLRRRQFWTFNLNCRELRSTEGGPRGCYYCQDLSLRAWGAGDGGEVNRWSDRGLQGILRWDV